MNLQDAEEYTQTLGQIVGASFRQIALANRLGVPAALGFKGKDGLKKWVNERLGGYAKMQITELKQAAIELREQEDLSNREIAPVLGVSPSAIDRLFRASDDAPDDEPNADEDTSVASNDASHLDAVPQQQKTRSENERSRKAELEEPPEIGLAPGLHLGDFKELSKGIVDGSVQLVFTDPPYDAASVGLYGDAARIAARILRPGGSFIAYSGQRHLPDVLSACRPYLKYWWTIAGVHGGETQVLNKLGVRCGWKPLIWFVKDTRGDVQNVLSDTVSGVREKDTHHWQQSEQEARYYIEKLTTPGGLVVDFFAGGGTTLVAAKKLGREFIGCEKDEKTKARASERLEAA